MSTNKLAEPDKFNFSRTDTENAPSEGHLDPKWEKVFAAERQKPTASEPREMDGFDTPRSMPDIIEV